VLSLSVLFRNKIFDFIFTDAFHHRISAATPFQRPNVVDLDSYYHNRILRWAGHVAGCSDAYDSGATAVAYWSGSTLKAEWMP